MATFLFSRLLKSRSSGTVAPQVRGKLSAYFLLLRLYNNCDDKYQLQLFAACFND